MSTMSVTDPRFETEARGYDAPPPQKRSKWMPCLIGCGIVVLGGILLAAVVAFYVYKNVRNLAAAGAEMVIGQSVKDSGMPAQEQQEVMAEVKRVTEGVRNGTVSNEQVQKLLENFMQSPLVPMFTVTALEKGYLDKSGLSEDEKKEGRITLQRFVRGAIDEKIDQQGIDAVMAHVSDKGPNGERRMRKQLGDEDIRAALAEAKIQADKAGIEDSPPAFDPSDELKKVIDEVLGPQGGAAPTVEEEETIDIIIDGQEFAEPTDELK